MAPDLYSLKSVITLHEPLLVIRVWRVGFSEDLHMVCSGPDYGVIVGSCQRMLIPTGCPFREESQLPMSANPLQNSNVRFGLGLDSHLLELYWKCGVATVLVELHWPILFKASPDLTAI